MLISVVQQSELAKCVCVYIYMCIYIYIYNYVLCMCVHAWMLSHFSCV